MKHLRIVFACSLAALLAACGLGRASTPAATSTPSPMPTSTQSPTATATLTPSHTPADCTQGWTTLLVGQRAIVGGDAGELPIVVRTGPGKSYDFLTNIYPGTVVRLLEGPVCLEGLVFWQVENASIPGGTGWASEGDLDEHWLVLYGTPTPTSTPSRTVTATFTPSPSRTPPPTATATFTPSPSRTVTTTFTPSPTRTPSRTVTATLAPSHTRTLSPTAAATLAPSPTGEAGRASFQGVSFALLNPKAATVPEGAYCPGGTERLHYVYPQSICFDITDYPVPYSERILDFLGSPRRFVRVFEVAKFQFSAAQSFVYGLYIQIYTGPNLSRLQMVPPLHVLSPNAIWYSDNQSNIAFMDYRSGRGVRGVFFGYYPPDNDSLLYMFNGLDRDNRYLVSVQLPIQVKSWADNPPDSDVGLYGVSVLLEAAGASDDFYPSLADLDALVQSIQVIDPVFP